MKAVKKVMAVSICIAVAVTVIVINWSKGEGAASEKTNVASGTSTVSGSNTKQEKKSKFKTNKYGETYGVADSETGEEPDLVAVVASNGKKGYIKQKEFDEKAGGNVSSPEEAVEFEKKTAGKILKIPVYNKDGDIVIGFFELTSGRTEDTTVSDRNSKFDIIPLDYNLSAKRKVKGYKYSYNICSGVWRYNSGKDKGYCEGVVRISNTGTKNVPAGYLGGMPRLYNKSKELLTSSKWTYNSVPIHMKTICTKKVKGNGKYYYSRSKARVYNGNGYDTYICNQSPIIKVSTGTEGYKVNDKGESYGSALDEEYIGGEPDLIKAVGIGGIHGYVKAVDFEVDNDTPKVAGKNSYANGESDDKTIPLYNKEGTVIGKFKIATKAEEIISEYDSGNEIKKEYIA